MKRFLYFVGIFLVSSVVFTVVVNRQPPGLSPPTIEVQPPDTGIPPPPPAPEFTVDDAIKGIQAKNLNEIVSKLCCKEFAGRQAGSKGGELAAAYIKDQFAKYGIKSIYQDFSAQGKRMRNIIGYIEGTTNKDEVVVIGAHMDHLGPTRSGICYGADDNASGTAAVLEIANAFSNFKEKLPRTIVFQCYDGEEHGLFGSKYYVNSPLFPRESPNIDKHIYMINLDMIGYYKDQSVMFSGSSGGASDHLSFYNKGVPCVFIHTGLNSYYHTPQDTPEKLNYAGMEKITKAAFKLAWEKVQSGHRTKVFEITPVPITHDHGKSPFPH